MRVKADMMGFTVWFTEKDTRVWAKAHQRPGICSTVLGRKIFASYYVKDLVDFGFYGKDKKLSGRAVCDIDVDELERMVKDLVQNEVN